MSELKYNDPQNLPMSAWFRYQATFPSTACMKAFLKKGSIDMKFTDDTPMDLRVGENNLKSK